jgi:Kef-type K+ transport system membrane component KefB
MTYSPKIAWILTGLALAIGLGGPAFMRLLHLDPWSRAVIAMLLILASCALAVRAWFYRDEIQRQTGTTAWFWGSLLGIVAGALFILVMRATGGMDHLVELAGGQQHNSHSYFALGFALSLLMQVAGYVIVRTALRLDKGGSA